MLAVFAVDLAADKDADPRPALLTPERHIAAAAQALLALRRIQSCPRRNRPAPRPAGIEAERLLLVGLGKAKDFSLDRIRKGAGTAVRAAKPRAMRDVAIAFPETHCASRRRRAELLRNADRSRARRRRGVRRGGLRHLSQRPQGSCGRLAYTDRAANPLRSWHVEIQRGFDEGRIVAAAQNFTRSLVNEPGNVLTPTVLGARAKAMCDEAGLKCDVYSSEKLQELKMGAFWAVAKGSAEPPALIVMTYEPATAPAAGRARAWAWSAKALPSTPAASPSSPRTAWRR